MIWGWDRRGWTPWYAWRPVRLMDGRYAWLETVEVASYYLHDVSPWAYFHLGLRGSWVARPVASGEGT